MADNKESQTTDKTFIGGNIPTALSEAVAALADRERRTFKDQMQVLLEEAMAARGAIKPVE